MTTRVFPARAVASPTEPAAAGPPVKVYGEEKVRETADEHKRTTGY